MDFDDTITFHQGHPALRCCASVTVWAVLGVVLTWAGAMAQAQPEPKHMRDSITRSLEFLGVSGDQWIAQKDCISCHHLPVLVWSHLEAERRGFKIDSKKLAAWIQWSAERVGGKNPGIEALSQFILARPAGREGLPAALRPAGLAGLIVAAQESDGSWKPGGQFASMQKRSQPEAQEASTRLNVLALASVAGDDASRAAARGRALGWLESRRDAPVSTETLVVRVLLARRLKEAKVAAAGCNQLLNLQHADGGWGWRRDEVQSDALATGQALYVLAGLHSKRSDQSAARARQWLLAHQRESGEWFTKSTLITALPGEAHIQRTDGIYTFWGTAWATLGLLESLPAARRPASVR